MRRLLSAFFFLLVLACKQEAPAWTAKEPSSDDRQAYFTFLISALPQTLEQVTCHCCNKSLMKCYRDMGDPNVRAKCPFG